MAERIAPVRASAIRYRLSWLLLLALIASQALTLMACGNDSNSPSRAPVPASSPQPSPALSPTPPPSPAPTPTATPTPTPVTFPQACSGQSLVAIDPVRNVGYVAIYQLDASGNAQLAIVDLTVGAVNPVLGTISLTGSVQPVSEVYNPQGPSILAEARDGANQVHIYEIDPATQSVVNSILATGLSHTGMSGGIVEDFVNNQAIVAGTSDLGILDTSTSPPTWNPASILDLSADEVTIDSMALDSFTGLLFISNLGNNFVVDTGNPPLTPIVFQIDPNESFSNGVAFDVGTDILFQSQMNESDSSYAFNFGKVNLVASPAFASNVYIGGLGFLDPVGQGPGGLAIVNCATHQGLIADQFGQNFKLIHLPRSPVKGGLDNNGQPGTKTVPNGSSAYTIAASVIPMGDVGGVPTQLGVVDDPSSLAIDPARNLAYMLADTDPAPHPWTPGAGTPLFLIRVDLSRPVFGASPIGGVDGKTFWNPASAAIPMP